jgi:hypothetical protein
MNVSRAENEMPSDQPGGESENKVRPASFCCLVSEDVEQAARICAAVPRSDAAAIQRRSVIGVPDREFPVRAQSAYADGDLSARGREVRLVNQCQRRFLTAFVTASILDVAVDICRKCCSAADKLSSLAPVWGAASARMPFMLTPHENSGG